MENKFSKHGYHSNKTIKKGDICELILFKFINKIPKNIATI